MNRFVKISVYNLIAVIMLLLLLETIIWSGRLVLGKKDLGYMYMKEVHELQDPCQVMRTHPILSHVHDHRGRCDVLGGQAELGFVYYSDMGHDNDVILTLGGSTTDGFFKMYSEGYTYPYVLNDLVAEYGITVANGGCGAYGSAQELLKLIVDFDNVIGNVKVVLSLNGINDIYGYYGVDEKGYKNRPYMTGLQSYMFDKQVWVKQNESFIGGYFPNIVKVLDLGGGGIHHNKIKNTFNEPLYKFAADRWRKNITAMRAIAESKGASYYVFLQPTLGLSGVQSVVDLDTNDGRLFSEMSSDYVDNLNSVYYYMKLYCRELEYCFDISDVAPPVGNNYSEERHHNENGNKIIADEIFKVLLSNELI